MIRWVAVALGLAVSMTVGAGQGLAHDASPGPDRRSWADHDDVVEVEGSLEVLHEDRFDGGRNHYFLSTRDGRRWSIKGVPPTRDLLTGDRVRVRGRRSDRGTLLLPADADGGNAGAVQVLALAPLSNTLGPQRTVVLLVNFSNDRSEPTTVSYMKTVMMPASDAFFRENSYGLTSLSVDVFGWYTLPITNATCSTSSIRTYAEQAATAAGVDLSPYTRRVYLFPLINSCGFTGASTVGGNPSSTWINGSPYVGTINHELGHALGLYHSHAMACSPGVLPGIPGTSCWTFEYGDEVDTMGRLYGHFNAFQKQRLGWLGHEDSPPITTVDTSGLHDIDAYEFPGAGPKALKIARGATGQSFFVELRRNVGWDTYLYRSGVFVRLVTESDPNSSYLLDMVPATPSFTDDAFLDVGATFVDPVSGTTITTIAVGSTSATILVAVGSSSCTRAAPRVTASPGQSDDVPAGTTVTYSVAVTNNDSAGCSASSFALQGTAPPGWQTTFGTPSVTLNPGATASTTVQVTSPAVAAGTYTIVATATSGASLSGSASVLYAVAGAGGGGTTGTFTDQFDRSDSSSLGNGWVVVSGALMVQDREARNPANATRNLAVQPGIAGSSQTVTTSFASTRNSSGPQFGVVVRYQSPQNYYTCYRKVGGSSVVRIARVQNGVETVLKSIGIANPIANALWTLSCQASGNTLTLRINGATKASVTDATFATGSVGYSISSGKVASHRADNFGATVQ